MNNIYVIFYLLNIFASQINAAPSISPATNAFDVIERFSKTCPVLGNNILVSSTTKYMSICKNVSLLNPPTYMNELNLDTFYCIGILVADMQLCNTLSNYKYEFLPQTFDELQSNVSSIQKIKPVEVCTLMKNVALFNNTTILPMFLTSVTVLKEILSGPKCPRFCTQYQNDENTNQLCSMIYYIHSHIANVSNAIAQEVSTVVAPKSTPSRNISIVLPNDNKPPKPVTVTQPNLSENGKTYKQQSQVSNHMSQVQLSNQVDVTPKNTITQIPPDAQPSADDANVNPQVKQEIAVPKPIDEKSTKQTSTISVPSSKAIVAISSDQQPQPTEKPPKIEQLPVKKGEDKSAQIKSTGDVTNPSLKQPETKVDPNIGPILADDNDYTPTSTEINYKKLSPANPDNLDEYNDDDDVDEENFKFNEEAAVVVNGEEKLINSRTNMNLNIKQQTGDVEESNFFSYFMFISVMFIAGYVVYHNKQKIMALLLEGRRERNSRRRPSTSSYRKLNSNLEEAVTSKCSGSASHVIY